MCPCPGGALTRHKISRIVSPSPRNVHNPRTYTHPLNSTGYRAPTSQHETYTSNITVIGQYSDATRVLGTYIYTVPCRWLYVPSYQGITRGLVGGGDLVRKTTEQEKRETQPAGPAHRPVVEDADEYIRLRFTAPLIPGGGAPDPTRHQECWPPK